MVFLYMLLTAYVLGAIPFGKLMGERYGIDIQKRGSGNIGFANCLRVLGWRPAVWVLAGDIAKGFVPVIVAASLLPLGQVQAVALAAVAGHIFPFWLRFRGGKGIATGLGVMIALNPWLAFVAAVVWLGFYIPTRLNSLASLVMIAALPFGAWIISPKMLPLSLCLTVLTAWAHRSNIRRLLARRESKLMVRSAS